MLQDVGNALSKLGGEIAEDQMRVRFTHRTNVLNVMAHDRIRNIEEGSRAIRQMAHDQTSRLAAMLIHNNQVCEIV